MLIIRIQFSYGRLSVTPLYVVFLSCVGRSHLLYYHWVAGGFAYFARLPDLVSSYFFVSPPILLQYFPLVPNPSMLSSIVFYYLSRSLFLFVALGDSPPLVEFSAFLATNFPFLYVVSCTASTEGWYFLTSMLKYGVQFSQNWKKK